MKILKSFEQFKLDNDIQEDFSKLNETVDFNQELVTKLITEKTVEGLESLLKEIELLDPVLEARFLDKLKKWGKRKIDLLQKKYKSLIDGETFSKVQSFIDGGGKIPKSKKDIAKFASEDPELANALDIITKGEED